MAFHPNPVLRGLGLTVALAAVTLCSATAQAEPVNPSSIDALSNPFGQVTTGNSTVSGSNWFTTGFTTGTNADFLNLTAVKLSLATSGTTTSTSPNVRIYSGVSNPTTLIQTFPSTSVSTSSPTTFTFSPSPTPLALTASTNYWIVLSASPGDSYGWYVTDEFPAEQNLSGYSFVAGKRSTNSGSTYSNNPLAQIGSVAIQVQAIPEPSTIILAGIGVAAAAAVDLKRRKQGRVRALNQAAMDEPVLA